MDAIFEQFLTEARENLSFLDQNLSNLSEGDDELINALFRAAHTLKGGAGLVGFEAVKELTHAAEDLLDAYRQKKIEYSEEMLDALYDAFDEVIEYIDAAEEMGDINIEVDMQRVDEIKNHLRGFLSNDDSSKEDIKEQKPAIDLPFNVDSNLGVAHLFTHTQASNLIKFASFDDDITEEEFYGIVDLNLDIDTIRLGHDPIYLIYLLGDDALLECAIEAYCEGLKEDKTNWVSRISIAIKSDVSTIEDSFYNILDEIVVRKLSFKALFDNPLVSLEENETYELFKKEFAQIVGSKKFSLLDEKLSAITQVINLETYEGFILTRLQALLQNFSQDDENFTKLLNIVCELLEIDVGSDLKSDNETTADINEQSQSDDSGNNKEDKEIDQEAIDSALAILKAQQKVLEHSKDDLVLDRTKRLLLSVLGFLGDEVSDELDAIDTKEELESFVARTIESIQKNSSKSLEKEQKKPEEIKKDEPKKAPLKKESSPAVHISKTVKIEQHQIDELMDIVGELLVLKNSLPYIANSIIKNPENSKRELLTKYEQISRLTDTLQDKAMGMRLLPLSYIFDRYPKMIRDISKKLGKKIKYIEEGKETKLDKAMIEKLADPMIHLIRNSLDHGLESEEERIKAGKDPVGIIKIVAKNEGDKVYITIEDDGRGIDEQKIVTKALEKNLVDPDSVDNMSKEEKLMLIFLPGLSTKEQITELSGRGVGADVVKKTIEELGGKIGIKSHLGQGTKITLTLPLSIALTNVFHIKMNEINYAIAMDHIVETEKIDAKDIKTATHKPFVRLRGEVVPLLVERRLLSKTFELKGEIPLVIISSDDRKVAMVVEEFMGQLDVMQKPLNGVLKNHPFISGSSLLGNGDVLFVLDINKLLGER